MASDPMAAVQQLQDIVATLAPILRPQVLPKGVGYGLDMIESLCITEKQRQTLLTFVCNQKPNGGKLFRSKNREKHTDMKENDDNYLKPQVIGMFDVKNRVFVVQNVQWMHEREAIVHEFARFMELQLENPAKAKLVVQHFLTINGHKAEDFTLAQQCFSAAFALQTLLRAFPKLPIAIGGLKIDLKEDSDVAQVFASLFVKSRKNKAKSGQKTKKRKSSR